MLKIYNTAVREKRVFLPIKPKKVGMYVCGMTVYDYCHLGHARVLVVFDMVYRWLKCSGFDVTYVRNITDIDDKIIKRALENGESIHKLTERFIDAMHEDADALGVLRPNHEPLATDYVSQMLEMIQKLENNGLAYQAADGDVNFAVRKFKGYGKLSGKSLEDLRAGERVHIADSKHDPLDFVLWKQAKVDEPAEVKWDSKWGKGRPGWHIECSAMSSQILGQHFDIHGGGADLQFPHHENEIAQSEGANQCSFVNYWMHNGFVNVDKEKMSKSLGNFFTIRDILKKYDAEVIRFFILRAHYRSPLNYSDAHLDDAKVSLTRLYTAIKPISFQASVKSPENEFDECFGDAFQKLEQLVSSGDNSINSAFIFRFKAALNDDFNTPEAVAVLFDLANEVNRNHSTILAKQLKDLAGVLGLLQRDPNSFLQSDLRHGGLSDESISTQITLRNVAKKDKKYSEADRIRKELTAEGIMLEDGPTGTTWRRI